MPYKVVLTFKPVDETLVCQWCVGIQMKATEQYFHLVLFISTILLGTRKMVRIGSIWVGTL